MASIFEEMMAASRELTESVRTSSRQGAKSAKKISCKNLKVESRKFFEENDPDEVSAQFDVPEGTDEDEVVLVIDPDIHDKDDIPEEGVEEYVGDLVYKCPVCGSNYMCDCDENGLSESIELGEDGKPVECPICGDDADQILIGEISPAEDQNHEDLEDHVDSVDADDSLEVKDFKDDEEDEEKEVDVEEKDVVIEESSDNIGRDLKKYQMWVDYDMKHYHKISEETQKLIDDAGLQLIKDDHGDYEVSVGRYEGIRKYKRVFGHRIVKESYTSDQVNEAVSQYINGIFSDFKNKSISTSDDHFNYMNLPKEYTRATYYSVGDIENEVRETIDELEIEGAPNPRDDEANEFYKEVAEGLSKYLIDQSIVSKVPEDFEHILPGEELDYEVFLFKGDGYAVLFDGLACWVLFNPGRRESKEYEGRVKIKKCSEKVSSNSSDLDFDEDKFESLMNNVLKENYKGINKFKVSEIRLNKDTLRIEYLVNNENKSKKGTLVSEGFDPSKRSFKLSFKDQGAFTESFSEEPSFVVECIKFNNKIVPTKLSYDFKVKVKESFYRVKGQSK